MVDGGGLVERGDCEGNYDCVNGNVVKCLDLGSSYVADTECTDGTHCVKDAEGYAYCDDDP